MNNQQKVTDAIINQGILPLYFNADLEVSLQTLKAIYKAGIRAVEYTNRGEDAFKNFEQMIELKKAEMPDLLLGIGTIKNLEDGKAFESLGADFFISPGLVPELAKYLVPKDLFYSPGCMTPTEIIAAENLGIKFIKLFPGNMLKPEFLSGIKDIFPNLKFMPTGGVDTTLESISSWYKAGVSAVGMGSKLISKDLMNSKNYSLIEQETTNVLAIIKQIKSSL